MKHLRIEHFDCECHSYDHAIRLCYDPTEDDVRFADLYIDCAFPTHRTLWERIKLAYKYITKSGTMDYTYGSWILRPSDLGRFRGLLNEYEEFVTKLEEKGRPNGNQQEDGV